MSTPTGGGLAAAFNRGAGPTVPAPSPKGLEGVLAFDRYPELEQLIPGGVSPGCLYAYVLPHNVAREVRASMSAGRRDLIWRQHEVGQFYVNGVPMVLLVAGTPIPDVPATNGRRRLLIDRDADAAVGYRPPPSAPEAPNEVPAGTPNTEVPQDGTQETAPRKR